MQSEDWNVRVEDSTVVVELPPSIELDKETGQQINEEFFEAVERPHVTNVLTLLEVENPLDSGLFEEVKRGADEAAANGITDWAIVVRKKIKGLAFKSQIDDLDTAVFEDEREAREFLN